jgi:hypothetical protein
MGNLTLVVATLSYAGQLNLTAAADQDSCPDVVVFAEGVRRALDDLAQSALVSATTDSDGEQRLLQQSVGAASVGGGR